MLRITTWMSLTDVILSKRIQTQKYEWYHSVYMKMETKENDCTVIGVRYMLTLVGWKLPIEGNL